MTAGGILQPLISIPEKNEEGKYVLTTGERSRGRQGSLENREDIPKNIKIQFRVFSETS